MDYGDLLKTAWVLTWRHKYLWVLGLFALGGGGSPLSCGSNPSFQTSGSSGSGTVDVADFFSRHWVVLVAFAIGFLLVGFIWAILSLIAEAGLIGGVDDRLQGRSPASLSTAWRTGVHSFWRLLGLVLFVGVVVALVFGIVIALIAIPLVIAATGDNGASPVAIGAVVLFALFLLLLSLPVVIILQIVMNWAFRSLVIERTGVFASLGAGWRLFRRNAGKSLVVWVLNVGLLIGLGLVIALPLMVIGIPIALAFAGSEHGFGPILVAGMALAGLAAIVVGGFVKAVSTTFFSAFWTIAWRRIATPTPAAVVLTAGTSPPVSTVVPAAPAPPDDAWRAAADPVATWPVTTPAPPDTILPPTAPTGLPAPPADTPTPAEPPDNGIDT